MRPPVLSYRCGRGLVGCKKASRLLEREQKIVAKHSTESVTQFGIRLNGSLVSIKQTQTNLALIAHVQLEMET